VLAFLRRWAEAMREGGMRKDQPALRELLWDSELRIATLPPEYNLLDLGAVRRWDRFRPAPRLIHHYRFHKHFTGRRREVATVEDLLGPMAAARLPMILAADRGLARLAGREPREPSLADRAGAFAAGLAGLPRWAAARAGFALRRLAGQ
jgi:hypothetical protein